jgi:hypothetical protein
MSMMGAWPDAIARDLNAKCAKVYALGFVRNE